MKRKTYLSLCGFTNNKFIMFHWSSCSGFTSGLLGYSGAFGTEGQPKTSLSHGQGPTDLLSFCILLFSSVTLPGPWKKILLLLLLLLLLLFPNCMFSGHLVLLGCARAILVVGLLKQLASSRADAADYEPLAPAPKQTGPGDGGGLPCHCSTIQPVRCTQWAQGHSCS